MRRILCVFCLSLFALSATGADPFRPDPVPEIFAWVDHIPSDVGESFWYFIEATGREVILPERLDLDGLHWDSVMDRMSISHSARRSRGNRTYQRGYLLRRMEGGVLAIPAQPVTVDGTTLETIPITLGDTHDADGEVGIMPTAGTDADGAPVRDLILIEMIADKREVYQGEAVVFRSQLWRVIHPTIDSGPSIAGENMVPTTVGFFVTKLDPRSFVAKRNSRQYDVWEEAMLLYPTAPGSGFIGAWRWGGVALVDRHNVRRRDRVYYDLQNGPLEIRVKPLPEAPPHFSGAVGQFTIRASLSADSVTEGVPVNLDVVVSGRGNPNAMGDPHIPAMRWAHVSYPERSIDVQELGVRGVESVSRRFSYLLTPLRSGDVEVPPIEYLYFDPEVGAFDTATVSSFMVSVLPSAEDKSRLVLADGIEASSGRVSVLAEDMRPLAEVSRPLRSRWPSSLTFGAATSLPVFAYLGFLAVGALRRDSVLSPAERARSAKSTAALGLKNIAECEDPAHELNAVVFRYLYDRFNLEGHGHTSADMDALLASHGIDGPLREDIVDVLRSCERARYGSQDFEAEMLPAFLTRVEDCLAQLDDVITERQTI